MGLRRKILLFFILGVIIPVIVIYYIALLFFHSNTRVGLQSLYTGNIHAAGRVVQGNFTAALDISLYPLMQNDIIDFLNPGSRQTETLSVIRENASMAIINNFSYRYSDNIRGVSICSADGRILNHGGCPSVTAQERKMIDAKGIIPQWIFPELPLDTIYVLRLLRSPRDFTTPIGYSKVRISRSGLLDNLTQVETGDEISYYLIDTDSRMVLTSKVNNQDSFAGPAGAFTYEELAAAADESVTAVTENGLFVSAYRVDRTPFVLFSLVRPAALSRTGYTLMTGFSVSAVAVAVFSVIIALVFSNIITVPLKKLGKNMDALSRENFSVRTQPKGKDEIARLTNHFNTMAERLDYLYREVYMGQILLQKANLNALQMQISPHFLYNTLDTIYWMSKLGENEKTAAMISSLSGMMRYTLTPDDKLLVALRDEMDHLQCYIGIQQIRHSDKIIFEADCPEGLYDCKVLKLLLQPLVENALIHGLDNGPGTVRIRIYENDEILIYDVMNNGTPIDPDMINRLISQPTGESRGFAINNIAERIRLKNGDGYSLTCFVDGEFSVFRVSQQLIREQEGTYDGTD